MFAKTTHTPELPKHGKLRGRLTGGVLIRHRGKQRRCFCNECRHRRESRSSEKRAWRQ